MKSIKVKNDQRKKKWAIMSQNGRQSRLSCLAATGSEEVWLI
jgi:hypothetical protein